MPITRYILLNVFEKVISKTTKITIILILLPRNFTRTNQRSSFLFMFWFSTEILAVIWVIFFWIFQSVDVDSHLAMLMLSTKWIRYWPLWRKSFSSSKYTYSSSSALVGDPNPLLGKRSSVKSKRRKESIASKAAIWKAGEREGGRWWFCQIRDVILLCPHHEWSA